MLTNLDRTRIKVNVLVFDATGNYVTRYQEGVLDRPDDPGRMVKELASSMRRTVHCADGRTLVCHDERLQRPVMVRAKARPTRIYAVTTATRISEDGADQGCATLEEHESVGFFTDVEDARVAILENRGDIHELNQDVAIVEAVDEGLYGCDPRVRLMFEWDHASQAYREVPWPAAMERICGFALS